MKLLVVIDMQNDFIDGSLGSDAAQAFISYITGDTFSSKIEEMGYGVASKMSSEAVAAHQTTK